MAVRKPFRRNRLQKAVFITVTVLIAIGLVIPLAGLFQGQMGGGETQDGNFSQQTLQERLSGLEVMARENPGDTNVLMELAEAYLYVGNPDQAAETYEQVLAVDPKNAEARIDIATVYYYTGEYDQAVTHLQEQIKMDPENKNARLLYGYVLGAGKKNYPAGITELEKFIEIAREGPEVEKAKQVIEEWKALTGSEQ